MNVETNTDLLNMVTPYIAKQDMFPKTEAEWLEIAREFERRWQFAHCLGFIDEKHITIVPPKGRTDRLLPYVFIGDEAFAMRRELIKPFRRDTLTRERRIFNYWYY
ncbi:uncharacterized protein LOC131214102 [Anopheles bellator]|uniref:uncharacterized protein LOC131214102 n=1 Tax=Anopheles bellator TaxID=139047 RepID=UPI0026484FF6|nr:uncharacterized protein LOC131214102 [Anopheles bellator]